MSEREDGGESGGVDGGVCGEQGGQDKIVDEFCYGELDGVVVKLVVVVESRVI